MKILIIEDNALNMKLASSLLEITGYETLQADNAESGIAVAKKEIPDLILMDIQLPGMDGVAATKLLKEEKLTKDIPIIAMTSFAMKGDKERMKEIGFDAYIPKPFDYKKFLTTIKYFLENKPHEMEAEGGVV